MSNRIPCPKCKSQAGEEVAPTSVWEHLVPEQLEVHEYVCFRCKYSWITERERFPNETTPPAATSEE